MLELTFTTTRAATSLEDRAYRMIVEAGGNLTVGEIVDALDADPIDVAAALTELGRAGLLGVARHGNPSAAAPTVRET